MITQAQIQAQRKSTELVVLQTLKHLGMVTVYKSLSECRRVYGREWFNNAVNSGKLVGVPQGNKTVYNVEDILALQQMELEEAIDQLPRVEW